MHDDDADLARELAAQCEGRYDMYVQLNLRSRDSEEGREAAAWWKRVCESCRVGMADFCDEEVAEEHPYYAGAWRHGQHSFTGARERIPVRYDRYWFFEYDARLDGNVADVMDAHRGYPHDLVGTWLGSWHDDPHWARWYDEPQRMRDGDRGYPLESMWKFFSVLCRLSGRLLDILAYEMRVEQYFLMQEPFVPTVCANQLGVRTMMDLLPCYWDREGVRYRPIHGSPQEWKDDLRHRPEYAGKLVHPVKAE
jgi:hypothetical protein